MATEGAPKTAFEAVILAAGSGSRFGGGKLLAPWGAGVLLEGALAAALAAPVRSCPSLSASSTATSSGESARKRRTAKRAPSRKPA